MSTKELHREALRLIGESQARDCIAHGKWSQDLEDHLLEQFAEDSVENGNVVEFWGEDSEGDWRVHLDKPETAEA